MGFDTHVKDAILVRVDSSAGLGDYLQLHIVSNWIQIENGLPYTAKISQDFIFFCFELVYIVNNGVRFKLKSYCVYAAVFGN